MTVTEIKWSRTCDNSYSRQCLSCTEFLVGLEIKGKIATVESCNQFEVFSGWGKQHSSECSGSSHGQRKQDKAPLMHRCASLTHYSLK